VSLDDLGVAKSIQDFGGHYNRFDIFDVRVLPGAYRNIRQVAGETGAPAQTAGAACPQIGSGAEDASARSPRSLRGSAAIGQIPSAAPGEGPWDSTPE
jgi:hypothetical protein